MKYDRTKFRPDFAIAPTQDNTTVIDQEETATVAHNRSFLESVSPSQSISDKWLNRHMQHKQEELNQPDSRVFLRNPRWPRDDIYASITNFRDN